MESILEPHDFNNGYILLTFVLRSIVSQYRTKKKAILEVCHY
jgi:hypothetical protein